MKPQRQREVHNGRGDQELPDTENPVYVVVSVVYAVVNCSGRVIILLF